MKIHELQPGDRITEQHQDQTIAFEVIAIRQIGRRCMVTFRSAFGLSSAHYQADAYIAAAR